MRALLAGFLFAACSSPAGKPVAEPTPTPSPSPVAETPKPVPTPQPDPAATPPVTLTEDTPKTTVSGNPFIVPAGWTYEVRGAATVLTPPEGNSHAVLVDVPAKDGAEALDLAWKAYKPDHTWPLLMASDLPDHEGWAHLKVYTYQTSPNEKRDVAAVTMTANDVWTVLLIDFDQAVEEKRGSQLGTLQGRLFPKGHTRESFAGKKPHALDAERIAMLTKFVETGEQELGIPGVSFGLIENGKVIYSGGVGVRELGKPAKVDGDTEFMIASNTKALTTLLLAKLVDGGKLTWDTPVTQLLPWFALGDAETTKQVLVKHLICACTGMPRQDFEWIFEYAHVTPEKAVKAMAKMQPTSKFGEMFQYSNEMAGVAGFVAGHVAYPKLELGAAYDKAMQGMVFDALGMKATTFDYARARRGNHATPHAQDIDGKTTIATAPINDAILPLRGAGAAWSTVNDMLKYVAMELAEGELPGGKRYIAKDPLLARRAPQVPIGKDATYGMGLMVDSKWGIPVVHHGGDLTGFHSDMIWLPELGIGAVVLTNGNPGWLLRDGFRRKLLEVLFDGHPEADDQLAANAKDYFASIAAQRKLVSVPADPAAVGKLGAKYHNEALGDVTVVKGKQLVFDFGEFKSEMASKANPDGTLSFVTTGPGIDGFEFVDDPRGLVMRDGQHEYVFAPVK
jgi:CubicO group peptidase (beta-lactamase class C family)